MQSYRTAQQAVKEVFERYPSISFEEAVKSYEEGEITTEDFLATSKMFLNCYNKMIAEVMEFFSSKTRRAKVLTVEELKEANPELTDEEMELMLKNQNSKEAKKAAKKAESDAKKAAKKIELSAARKQATEERKLMKAEDNNSRKSQVLETLAAKDDSSISSSDNESEISEENEVDKDDDSSESIEENEVKATEEVVKVDDNEEKEELAIVDEISDKNDLLAVVESIADELQSIELKKANLAVVELEKANLAMVELKTELNKVEQRVETTKVKKVSKPKIKVKEPEARHIVNHDGDVTTIHDTKTHMKYILREGKCFTENKLLGKWNPKQDSIEYFNLGQDEAKPITFTKVYDAEAETFFENKSAYITGDCIVYLNGDGEVWGRYDPSSNTIHAEEEEEDYDEEE